MVACTCGCMVRIRTNLASAHAELTIMAFNTSNTIIESELSEFSSFNSEVCEESEVDGLNKSLTVSEKLKLRCSPGKCHVRWVKTKGAILVLLWNSLTIDLVTMVVLVSAFFGSTANPQVISVANGFTQALSQMIVYPLSGWLADVYFGRYKVIRTSLWLMWAGMMGIVASLCIRNSVEDPHVSIVVLTHVIFFIALLFVECGIAGFKATVVPYGADQLLESSGSELSAYISWFTFTTAITAIVTLGPYACFVDKLGYSFLAMSLTYAVLLSVVLCLNSFLKHWLIIEPGTRNPLKMIYRILDYARKNKTARFRSAFTYHIDKIPSRIEMAKPEYGGPFTTEQVEDVKTFFRVVYVLLPAAAMIIIAIDGVQSTQLLSYQLLPTSDCITTSILSDIFTFLSVLVILPAYELLVHPLLHNFIPSMFARIGFGFVLYILAFIALLAIDTAGHASIAKSTNATVALPGTCLFSVVPHSLILPVSTEWLAVPGVLLALGLILNLTAVNEFILAQSPHGMKGLLMGMIYGLEGVYVLILTLVQLPFRFGAVHTLVVFPSCSSIYFLVMLGFSLVVLVWFVYIAVHYKKRERDPPENIHRVFVEQIYDKYLQK